MEFVLFIMFVALIGLIPANIAKNKGRDFGVWWLYGAALFIVALPHALMMTKSTEGMKKCPSCAEMIKAEALVCRYCGKDLPVSRPKADVIPNEEYSLLREYQKERAKKAGAYGDYRKCPYCAEAVQRNATRCTRCKDVSEYLCERLGADLSTAAGVACDERPTRWASRVHVTPAG